MTIQDMEADPEFATLGYADQTALRGGFFQSHIAVDPEFQLLAPEEKQALYQQVIEAPPVLRQAKSSEFDIARGLVDRMKMAPDLASQTQAVNEAVNYSSLRSGTKAMLIPTLVLKGVDAVAKLFDPSQEDGQYEDYYGSDGDKINEWLGANVGKYGGPGALQALAGQTSAIGIAGNIIEFMDMDVATGGLAGGSAASAAVKSALMNTKAFKGWNMAMALGPITAESVSSGLVMTGFDMLRRAIQDPGEKQAFQTIARDFGDNVLWNYLGYGIIKAIGGVGKGVGSAMKGFKSDVAEKPLEDAFKVFTPEQQALKQMSPEGFAKLAGDEALYRVNKLDPRSDLGFTVAAESMMYHPNFLKSGEVEWNHLLDSTKNFTSPDRSHAAKKLAEMMVTGEAGLASPETAVKKLASAASQTSQIRATLVKELDDTTSPQELSKLLIPMAGAFDEGASTLFARKWLERAGLPADVASKVKVILDDELARGMAGDGLEIVLPKLAKDFNTEKAFNEVMLKRLEDISAGHGKPLTQDQLFGLKSSMDQLGEVKALGSLTHEGADWLATKVGASLAPLGKGRFLVNGIEHADLAHAQADLLSQAVEKNVLSLDQVNAIIQQRTGFTLRKTEVPMAQGEEAKKLMAAGQAEVKRPLYALGKLVQEGSSKPGWKEFAQSETLGGLLAQHPEVDFRLPTSMAPQAFIVDPSTSRIMFEKNVATGPVGQLLFFGKNFMDSSIGQNVLEATPKGKIVKAGEQSYRFVNDALGYSEEFGTMGAAKKKLAKLEKGFKEVEQAGAMKGLKHEYLPDGSIAIVDGSGKVERVTGMDELQAFHKDRPTADWITEMMPIPAETLEQARKTIEGVEGVRITKYPLGVHVPNIMATMAPSEMTLARYARVHGDYSLTRLFKGNRNGIRLTEAQNFKQAAEVAGIFKGTQGADRIKMAVASGWDEGIRADRFKKVFGEDLRPDLASKITKAREFMDEAWASFSPGESWQKLQNYTARIRDWASTNPDEVADALTSRELLSHVFPEGIPKGFEFFAENLRSTDIIRIALKEDLQDQMLAYVYAMNKKKFMDPMLKQSIDGLKAIEASGGKSKFAPEEVAFFKDTLMQLSNASSYFADSMKQETKRVAGALHGIMSKVPFLKKDLADKVLIDSVIDAAHKQITLSTQATKPWTLIRNHFQWTLLGATIGNQRAWKAVKEVVDEPAHATINRVIRSGSVQDSLFAHGWTDLSADMDFWHRAMKWNENVDILTRAACFKAGDGLIDDALGRLNKGLIDEKRFVREAQLSILDEDSRLQVLQAIKSGDTALAKDIFGDQLQKLTMFDYSKIQKGYFMRGTMGKVFGKFGTYPAGAMALYQRMLTSGTGGERVARVARLVLTSTALYEAFKQVGINYQGFLWTDPFGFQGGPLWDTMVSGTKIIGSRPENVMARKEIMRNLPSILSPNLATINRFSKVLQQLDSGDIQSAAITMAGAPVRKDVMWTQRDF